MTAKDSPLRDAAPAGNPNSYASKEQITGYLRGVSPGPVTASGQGYLDLADSYDKAMTGLRTFAHDLANAWKGPASNAAQGQLRELFSAAFEISSRSQQVGTAVKTHGTSYLAWYKANMPTPKTLEEARQWMQGANERAAQTWTAIPADISTSLPPVESGRRELGAPAGGSGSGAGSGTPVGGGGGSGSIGSGGAGATGPGAGGTGGYLYGSSGGGVPGDSPHFHNGSSGSVIGHPAKNDGGQPGGTVPAPGEGGSTELSGFSPSGTAPAGLGSEGPGAYGIGGKGFAPFGPPGSAGGLPGGGAGGGLPGGIGSLPGMGSGEVPGPGAIGGATGRGATAAGRNPLTGRTGVPAGGIHGAPGHGGREGKERERGAWLPDDQDIWDGDLEAVPGVIGNAPPKAVPSEKAAEESPTDEAALLRRVLARLAELESSEYSAPPPPAPPRMEWTD